jgi:hypothetical protein
MKKVITLVTLLLIAAIVVPVFAADKPAASKPAAPAKEQTLTGKVSVVKDKEGKVTEVALTVGEVKYMVTLNEEGKKLEALDGKEVKAMGMVHAKGEVKWLTVKSFEEVKAPAPAAAPKK